MTERAPVLTPTEARQASPRRMNFRVLITSMALALIAAAVVYFVFYAYPRPSSVPAQQPAPTAPANP